MPWLSCSATLDPVMLAEVIDLCRFNPDVRIQRSPVDRPDITFKIRSIQHPTSSFRDLEFIIEPVKVAVEQAAKEKSDNMARDALKRGDLATARTIIAEHTHQQIKQAGSASPACCRKIPKTIVYIDSITQVVATAKVLIKALIQAGCSRTSAEDAVQVYHSELAEFDKKSISAEFVKPDTESVLQSSKHCIIIATDAMEMGIDNPDVRLVIQWKQLPSMCALLQ